MPDLDKTLYRRVERLPEGRQKEAHKDAWEVYPTYVQDCRLTRIKKEYLRTEYIKLILNEKRHIKQPR